MKLPFHTFKIAAPCIPNTHFSECIDKAMNNPPISAVTVDDILGFPQSYDIVFNEGIYFILTFIVIRTIWIDFLKKQIKN